MVKRVVTGLWLALGLAALASPARADVDWLVSGVFADGGTLGGTFSVNQYGFISNYDIVTTTTTGMPGYEYTPATVSGGNDAHSLVLQFDSYQDALVLMFSADLTGAATDGTLLAGSYECRDSYSCGSAPQTTDGASSRALVSGSTADPASAVPEPASWTMMILGFGMIGTAIRTRRAHALA